MKDPTNNNIFLFGDNGITGVHSHDVCFPLKIMIRKDSLDLHNTEFKPFYDSINLFEEKYGNNNNDSGETAMNNKRSLEICHPADMSALQKLVGHGGAIKNAKYACYCCNMHIDKVHMPNLFPCEFCIEHSKTKGYHHKVCIESLWQ